LTRLKEVKDICLTFVALERRDSFTIWYFLRKKKDSEHTRQKRTGKAFLIFKIRGLLVSLFNKPLFTPPSYFDPEKSTPVEPFLYDSSPIVPFLPPPSLTPQSPPPKQPNHVEIRDYVDETPQEKGYPTFIIKKFTPFQPTCYQYCT